MSFFTGLLGSESVQKLAFGSIKKLIREKDLKCIIISLDDQGEIKLEFINNQNQKVNATEIS